MTYVSGLVVDKSGGVYSFGRYRWALGRDCSPTDDAHSAEIILIFELTGDFDLVSEPIVFVSMRSIRNWYQI